MPDCLFSFIELLEILSTSLSVGSVLLSCASQIFFDGNKQACWQIDRLRVSFLSHIQVDEYALVLFCVIQCSLKYSNIADVKEICCISEQAKNEYILLPCEIGMFCMHS